MTTIVNSNCFIVKFTVFKQNRFRFRREMRRSSTPRTVFDREFCLVGTLVRSHFFFIMGWKTRMDLDFIRKIIPYSVSGWVKTEIGIIYYDILIKTGKIKYQRICRLTIDYESCDMRKILEFSHKNVSKIYRMLRDINEYSIGQSIEFALYIYIYIYSRLLFTYSYLSWALLHCRVVMYVNVITERYVMRRAIIT